MPNTPSFPQYRIGEFAHFMGVSSDFLKHYEENGLLSVHVSDSGYRYYSFEQAARIIEYLRLKNYGVSVKEMGAILQHSPDEAFDILNTKIIQLSRHIEHMQAVVDEQKRLYGWYQIRRQQPLDWEINEVEPWLFLCHTNKRDFLKDPAIYDILNEWLEWLPIVKSALYLEHNPTTQTYDQFWGLAIPESAAQHHQLSINSAVKRLPFGKTFTFHFFNVAKAFHISPLENGIHPGFGQLKELGLEPAGPSLLINDLRLSSADGIARYGMGRLLVPLKNNLP